MRDIPIDHDFFATIPFYRSKFVHAVETYSLESGVILTSSIKDIRSLQIIYVTDVRCSIFNDFDIDACKNMFSYTKSGKPILEIGYLNDIITKTTNYHKDISTPERANKYIKREFTLTIV